MPKVYVRGREKFQKLKPVFNIMVKLVKILPIKVRVKKFTKYCKKGEGLFWVGVRYIYLKSIAKTCGEAVAVYSNTYILNPQKCLRLLQDRRNQGQDLHPS